MAALCVLASCSNSSKQEKADSSSADSVQTLTHNLNIVGL